MENCVAVKMNRRKLYIATQMDRTKMIEAEEKYMQGWAKVDLQLWDHETQYIIMC